MSVIDIPDAEDTTLTDQFAAEWGEISRRCDLSRHDTLDRIVRAAAESWSLHALSRAARISREDLVGILTWFGIADESHGAATAWPPEDLDQRLGMIISGHLPEPARARKWRCEQLLGKDPMQLVSRDKHESFESVRKRGKILRIIASEPTPVTQRDIRAWSTFSDDQVQRYVKQLKDNNLIVGERGDEDKRVIRYRVADSVGGFDG